MNKKRNRADLINKNNAFILMPFLPVVIFLLSLLFNGHMDYALTFYILLNTISFLFLALFFAVKNLRVIAYLNRKYSNFNSIWLTQRKLFLFARQQHDTKAIKQIEKTKGIIRTMIAYAIIFLSGIVLLILFI